ncbi:MAG: hypothetical protein Salg2KO_17440 [Salibacteraceae bacterium]
MVYPDKRQMNLTWLIIGAGVAVAFIVAKELFFRKIENVAELSSMTDVSV